MKAATRRSAFSNGVLQSELLTAFTSLPCPMRRIRCGCVEAKSAVFPAAGDFKEMQF